MLDLELEAILPDFKVHVSTLYILSEHTTLGDLQISFHSVSLSKYLLTTYHVPVLDTYMIKKKKSGEVPRHIILTFFWGRRETTNVPTRE